MLRNEELIERVLYESDFPVMRYFCDIPPEDYYRQKISEAKNALEELNFIE